MSSKPELRIDWATHEAARFACERWHYSRVIPKSKLAKFGVWEDGAFVYLMPLDDAMREKIAPLAKPYPKRAKKHDAGHPPAVGGAVPTRALHLTEVA